MERRYFDSSHSACVRAGVSEQPGHPEKFKVAAGVCGTVGAMWWTRRGEGVVVPLFFFVMLRYVFVMLSWVGLGGVDLGWVWLGWVVLC